MKNAVVCKNHIRGRVRGYRVFPSGLWLPATNWQPNTVMYEWGRIVSELLMGNPDGRPYHIANAYIEFENNGGAAVSPPEILRDEGRSYYEDLAPSPNRDYLRVPVTATALESSDEEAYPNGNEPTFFIQTSGSNGVNGKEFSDSVQSRVYGGALVASPVIGDPSQDLVFSRCYFAEENQLIKLPGSQLGITWPLTLL